MKFFNLRKSGKIDKAWKMIDEKSKNLTGFNLFKKYCFVYKVESFKIAKKSNYFEVDYKFYDKKFKKNSKQLYTFYISKTKEHLKFKNHKIIFAYPLFLKIREAIEKHNQNKIKSIIDKMTKIDKKNPDIISLKQRMFLE